MGSEFHHEHATVGDIGKKSFLDEAVHRFPYGSAAYTQFLGKSFNINAGTGFEAMICDHLLENRIHLIAQPLFADHHVHLTGSIEPKEELVKLFHVLYFIFHEIIT
jgi:hypothetical protein